MLNTRYLVKAFKHWVMIVLSCSYSLAMTQESEEYPPLTFGHFSIERELVLPGNPEKIYDVVTGDISPWWDMRFSKKPHRMLLEAVPGGGFWEIFDESGDGVKHATVIYAQRGKMLRFEGPLGLSGRAVQYVTTYHFEPLGEDKTLFRVSVHVSGAYEAAVPEMTEQMWEKLLFKSLLNYVEQQKN